MAVARTTVATTRTMTQEICLSVDGVMLTIDELEIVFPLDNARSVAGCCRSPLFGQKVKVYRSP